MITNPKGTRMKNPKFLITHSGRFHADDVCAGAMLSEIFPEAPLVRTRNDKIIESHSGQSIIFDVGRAYNPAEGRFDHHMNEAAVRENGVTYSSFGLIWKEYGQTYLEKIGVDIDVLQSVYDRFDREVVLPVDMVDTGSLSPADIGLAAGISLGAMVDAFNTPFDDSDPKNADNAYNRALQMVAGTLKQQAISMAAEVRAENLIEQAIHDQWGDAVLELDYSIDAQAVMDRLEAGHILLVAQPSSSGGYGLTVARESAGSYVNIIDLPEAWAGLSGTELEAVSGIKGASFCHTARFFAAADTREAIMKMAASALEARTPDPGMSS